MNILNMSEVKKFIKSKNIIDWTKIVLVTIFFIAIAVYVFEKKGRDNVDQTNLKNMVATTTGAVKVIPSQNVTSRCNFKVTSPAMYSSVTMPFVVKGILDKANTNTGCIWNENARRAGDAEIFYNRRGEGWKSAGTAVPIITTSHLGGATTTLAFSVSFNLYTKALGLTSGTPIKIVFTELNIPPRPNPDVFDFQVSLK